VCTFILGSALEETMKTDKQIYKVFAARPDWFFDLTQIDPPGPCKFRSVAMKEDRT